MDVKEYTMAKIKTEHFYMRIRPEQKAELRELADKKDMSMSGYIWHLITKDKEKNHAKNKTVTG